MRVITRQMLANEAASSWKRQYYGWTDQSKVAIGEQLEALGDSPLADRVDKVIGNQSWTRLTCDDCDKVVDRVVQLGQPLDYDSRTANVCADCFAKAVRLMEVEE